MAYPVSHISYSSMRMYHTNPGGWKDKYILNNYTYKSGPAAIVGKMAHSVVADYIKDGKEIQVGQAEQLEQFNKLDFETIKWWKTWSPEKVIQDFGNALKMFFEEMPEYKNVLLVEECIEKPISDIIDGRTVVSPLPFYGYPDLIFQEDNGDIIVEDFKFKIAHTKDEEGPHPVYWTQACFYYYLAREKFQREPKEMRFREVKIGKNKDGSSQHNVITLNFQSEDFQMQKSFFWYQLLGMMRAIEDMDADTYCFYNTFDLMTGREAFEMMLNTQFGYKMDKNEKTDLVKVDRSEIKEARYIESKGAETIEGQIQQKFLEFGVALQYNPENVRQQGYAFDRYLFTPSRGVAMATVKKYTEDVAQATEMQNIRILAPVPGTKFVGVEVPRADRKFVQWNKEDKTPVGVDINGETVLWDMTDSSTPHLLVAGSTGSGKSEFLKVLIESRPAGIDLFLIDPKRVELARFKKEAFMYANMEKDALEMLQFLVADMHKRYELMERKGATNISEIGENRVMCVIEEFANLRLGSVGGAIEDALEMLTNMGRAAGIHMIIATQRPDVKIVSGRIKNNIGTRVCFTVASSIDSTVILEKPGAEKLSGKGDMLFLYPGKDLQRLQSFYI